MDQKLGSERQSWVFQLKEKKVEIMGFLFQKGFVYVSHGTNSKLLI